MTEWGLYVEIIENKCEGMIRIKDIASDYFIFDEKPDFYTWVGAIVIFLGILIITIRDKIKKC